MIKYPDQKWSANEISSAVYELLGSQAIALQAVLGEQMPLEQFLPGKMLRTKLAARIYASVATPPTATDLSNGCAAVEMVHTASLFHDDLIDQGMMRRSRPTLWQCTSASFAVLAGDLLLCQAMSLILGIDNARHAPDFARKTTEVCLTEAKQELLQRGQILDQQSCLEIARGKTGPLFAFATRLCGNADPKLSAALEEAGYCVGTAYQLCDDLLDVAGSEAETHKTLRTDRQRGKHTLAQIPHTGAALTAKCVQAQFDNAQHVLQPWPRVAASVRNYIREDLLPLLPAEQQQLLAGLAGAEPAGHQATKELQP